MSQNLNRVDVIDREEAADTTADTGSSESVEWRDLSAEVDVADRIRTQSGEPLTIETGAVTATLVGVPRVRIDDLVYAHQRKRLRDNTRACALFDVANTSDVPIRWTSRRTKFIGSDSYTYGTAHVSLDPSQLGPGCYPTQVEIEPGCRARVITPVERLPEAVDVANVIQTVLFNGHLGNQRLTYRFD